MARRVGKFEAADGGTLLLDEISEMDVRLQAKLLRALQEREIDRLGGAAPVRVNVRILATTNRDLATEAARGGFREDLYFRLNVVSLHVPPLRERPGDVAALAEYFARRYAEVNGLAYRPVSRAAQALLLAHGWRGNVRELENTIHRAVLLAGGEEIGAEAIELGAPTTRAAASGPAAATRGGGQTTRIVGQQVGFDPVGHPRIALGPGPRGGDHGPALVDQGLNERPADEARRAGDQDPPAHAVSSARRGQARSRSLITLGGAGQAMARAGSA